jgi:predicted CoA-substrate-specific enzyme activase
MTQEYWKWPESDWTSDSIDWRKAEGITAGIDVGTTSTQAVVLADGELFGYANIHTGVDFKKAAGSALEKAIGDSGLAAKNIMGVGATGWGGKNIGHATARVDEVSAHMKGARFMFGPSVHTVVDLGGQTVKSMRLYDWDRVWDVMMNDKCATGFGRNIEFVCDLMEIPIEEIGPKSLEAENDPEPVGMSCCNFAETEAIGLLGRPEFRAAPMTEAEIYAAYLFAVAWRALNTIGKIMPLDVGDVKIHYPELAFTGGMAKNPGITKRLERELRTTALTSEYDPMLAGAIGAALLA